MMFKIRTTVIFFLLVSFNLFSQTSYTLDWLKLDEDLRIRWSWSPLDTFEGRLYRSNQIGEGRRKITILCSKKSSSYVLAFNKILEVMEEKLPSVEFRVFNFNNDQGRASEIVKITIDDKPDMILTMGSEAMIFASNNLNNLDIPVVTCINKDPVFLGFVEDYQRGSGTNIAYSSVNVPLTVYIQWLTKLKPNLKAVTILYDPGHSSVVTSEVEPLISYLREKGIHYFRGGVASGNNFEEDLGRVIEENRSNMYEVDQGLENSLFWLTSSTNLFSEMEKIGRHTGGIPITSSVPSTVNGSDHSSVLAIGIDRRNSAELAALYMVEILTGRSKPGELPVGIVTPPDISISFKASKKLGIKIPFEIFENSRFIYGYDGEILRSFGKNVKGGKE